MLRPGAPRPDFPEVGVVTMLCTAGTIDRVDGEEDFPCFTIAVEAVAALALTGTGLTSI